jgi:hypothetical protein
LPDVPLRRSAALLFGLLFKALGAVPVKSQKAKALLRGGLGDRGGRCRDPDGGFYAVFAAVGLRIGPSHDATEGREQVADVGAERDRDLDDRGTYGTRDETGGTRHER